MLERYLVSGEKGYRQAPANTSSTKGTAFRDMFSLMILVGRLQMAGVPS